MSSTQTTVKHTPGPWNLYEKHGGELDTTITATANGSQILICDVIGCRNNEGVITKETAKANAKLIAAAPELLEALNKVMSCIKSTSDLIKLGDSIYDIRYEIEAAIQKATH
jgi:hypothetical protein